MRNGWIRTFGLFSVIAMVTFPAAAGWMFHMVDAECGRCGTPRSLDLDSLQYPHISYYCHNQYRKDLRYAYYNGTGWVYDTVDVAGDVGKYSSLKLDTVGANISYYGNGDLKFAYWDGSGWNIEVVDGGNVSYDTYTSLALDLSNGLRHISYQRDNHLCHAWWDGTWHTEVVDPGNWTGYQSCIDLDPNNYPCISYRDAMVDQLKFAYWDGSGWHLETVANAPDYTSLVVDPGGVAHIAYKWVTSITTGVLRYTTRNAPGNWAGETVVPGPPSVYGSFPSLRIDVGGNPWIAFEDGFNKDLLLAHKEGAWQVDTVDYVTEVGESNSLALRHGSQPCVSYYSRGEDWLKYAEAAWVDVGVDTILAPPDTISPVPQTPEARIKNFGNFAVDTPFAVTCTIGAWGDSRMVPAPFGVGSTYVCTFANWTPPGPGTHTMCVTTQLADSNSANDQL